MNRAKQIYQNVINAMQDAEEIEGVENFLEYQALMRSICIEANQRLKNSQSNMETENAS
jgi:hypothetical protein